MNDPWASLEYAEWKDTLHAVHMIWSATAGSMGFSRTATAMWSAGATRRRGSATPGDRRAHHGTAIGSARGPDPVVGP
jgi:hypothetical protein